MKKAVRNISANIEMHFSRYLEKGSPESLHQFRVNVRRLCSFLENRRDAESVFWFQRWKKWLKSSNTIRDMDVFLDWSASVLSPEEIQLIEHCVFQKKPRISSSSFVKKMKKKMPKFQKKWLCFVNRTHFDCTVESVEKMFFVSLDDLKETILKQMKNEKEKRWHRLRIKIKVARYNYELFSLLQTGKDERSQMLALHLKKYQKLLGEFHDAHVHHEITESLCRKPSMDKKTKRVVCLLKKHIDCRINSLFLEIKKQLLSEEMLNLLSLEYSQKQLF